MGPLQEQSRGEHPFVLIRRKEYLSLANRRPPSDHPSILSPLPSEMKKDATTILIFLQFPSLCPLHASFATTRRHASTERTLILQEERAQGDYQKAGIPTPLDHQVFSSDRLLLPFVSHLPFCPHAGQNTTNIHTYKTS